MYFKCAPGPNGKSKPIQINSKTDQKIKKAIEYGSINAINVPTRAFGSYLLAKAKINGK